MENEKWLISAEPIYNGIALYLAENAYLNDTAQSALEMVAKWIREAPTVDAVEVVRCKDCKNCDGVIYGGRCKYWSSPIAGITHFTSADDYCSYGERKDNEKTT